MGTRFSAIDPKFLTEEDMMACGLLPSAGASGFTSTASGADEDN